MSLLIRPMYLFGIGWALIFLGPTLQLIGFWHPFLSLSKVVVLMGVVLYFIKSSITKKVSFPTDINFLFIILFLSFLLFSGIRTRNIQYAKLILPRYIGLCVLYVLTLSEMQGMEDTALIVKIVALTGLLNGLAAIFQSVFNYLPPGVKDYPWNHVGPFLRAGTGLCDENFLGAFLAFSAICSLVSFLEKASWLYFVSHVFSLAGLFFTFSRGATLNFLLSLFSLFFLLRKVERFTLKSLLDKFKKVVILLVGLGVLLLLSPLRENILTALKGFVLRVSSQTSESQLAVYSRLYQYSQAFQELVDLKVFLFGLGLGEFELRYKEVVHNSFLSIWVEMGFPAFASFTFIWLISLFRIILKYVKCRSNESCITVVGVLSAYIGWTFQSLTLDAAYTALFWLMFVLSSSFAFIKPANVIPFFESYPEE